MKHRTCKLCLCAMLLAMTLVLWGCGEESPPVSPETEAIPAQTTAPAVPETQTPETEAPEERLPAMEIETPYGFLRYPADLVQTLRTEVTGEDFDTAVNFYGSVGEEEFLLFTLHFGGGDGFPVGVLQTKEGVMLDITAEMTDLPLKDSWTPEETDKICAMQEALNFVMDEMEQLPGFTPAE